MAIALKNAKVNIKLFFSSLVLLDFSILFQIFCPGLYVKHSIFKTCPKLKRKLLQRGRWRVSSQPAFTCLKSTIETTEQCMKSVQK